VSASFLKTALVLAVLAAVVYVVYVRLYQEPETGKPPSEVSESWAGGPPKIEGVEAGAGGVGTAGGLEKPPTPTEGAFGMRVPLAGPGANNPVSGVPAGGPWDGPASPVATVPVPDPPAPAGSRGDVSNALPPSDNAEAGQRGFKRDMDAAQAKLAKRQLGEALLLLSAWYGDPRLSAQQERELTRLLGELAGTVIYSREHLLEPPYVVRFGDTLESIAQSYNVPWQLLAKINGLRSPGDLQPNQQLKVIRGPFHAIVKADRCELVLMVDGRYGGRFRIGLGRDCPPSDRYLVRGKTSGPERRDPTQRADPAQPPAGRSIDLGDGVAIRGTNELQDLGRRGGRGFIYVSNSDMEELCDILMVGSNSSHGSTVFIAR
jgi:hypothetical protein